MVHVEGNVSQGSHLLCCTLVLVWEARLNYQSVEVALLWRSSDREHRLHFQDGFGTSAPSIDPVQVLNEFDESLSSGAYFYYPWRQDEATGNITVINSDREHVPTGELNTITGWVMHSPACSLWYTESPAVFVIFCGSWNGAARTDVSSVKNKQRRRRLLLCQS